MYVWERDALVVLHEEVHILTKLGFTETQTKLYLTLRKIGKANGRTLAKHAKVPRTVVYRVLDELQYKGMVEKEITQPYTFRAIPIQAGLKLLLKQKIDEDEEIRKETVIFLRKATKEGEKSSHEQNYKLVMIERKERIIQRVKQLHDNAKLCVDLLTTLQRLLQFLHETYCNMEEALLRGVQYRVVLDSFYNKTGLQTNLRALLSKPNFSLRLSNSALSVNAIVFDAKEACFCFYPSQPVQNSPIIWTNHPSFLAMYQNYFETVWQSAKTPTISQIAPEAFCE